jgi:AcrR family transcriptional regulator
MTEEPIKVDGRSLRYKDRRQELLDAATLYVVQNGLTDLSMRPLAQALGISHTSLSAHFRSKDNLISEILENFRRYSVGLQNQISAPADGDPPSLDPYYRWWKRWTQDQYLPALQLVFEVVGLAIRNPDQYEQFRGSIIADWLKVTEPLLIACGCPPEETAETATSMVAHMAGLEADLLMTGDRERVDRAHASYVRMLEARRMEWIAAARERASVPG